MTGENLSGSVLRSISSVADVTSGYWGQAESKRDAPVSVQVLRNGDLAGDSLRGTSATRYFSQKEADRASVSVGDIVLTSSGECGKVAHVGVDGLSVSNFVKRLRVTDRRVEPRWLYYALRSPQTKFVLDDFTKGTTIKNLQKEFFSQEFLLIPSLKEQHEIVRILDELFSRLDAAAATIAAVRRKANQFRRSLLHAAFTGAFTHTGARRVSSTTKTRPFPPGPGWLMTSLAEHVNHKSGDSKIIKGKQSVSPGPGLVQGFSASGPDVWVKQVQYHGPGVVVSAVGARCGKTFLADGEWTAIANTHAIIPKDGLDSKYLWYVTNREEWWVKSGTAQPFVKVKDTLERPFHLPSLAEQQKIVQILEEQLSRQEASLALADEVERKVGVLRQSLLHAAFSGELTKEWREKNNG